MSEQSSALPSLFDACKPREDVIDGTLEEEQFAASLAAVAHTPEEAPAVYRDPTEFFNSTYPTEGLRSLLTSLSARFVAAHGGDNSGYKSSVLCLDTTFGGGKTHDLISAYHLANNPLDVENLSDYLTDDDVASDYTSAVESGLDIETAVFVGGYVDAQNARSDYNDVSAPDTNTMWGEIAYQLFGAEGYEEMKSYDRDRNAPSTAPLKQFFKKFDGPSLILIDEIAAYIEDASGVNVGDATLASQTLSFMMSLLETASQLDDVLIVYSIADTAFEDEAEDVRKLVDELDQIGKRQHKTITPTGETEVGAVLQHRLFEEIDTTGGSTVSDHYFQFYDNAPRQLPQEVSEDSYRQKLEREYPFHPSVITTLTEKIDTIPDFQRTRGALKLLARAIHHLWNNSPAEYDRHFIRLYDLTPADNAPDGSIRATLNESLFEFVNLSAAVNADVHTSDGTAHAQLEDRKWTEKGIPALGTHITTTVLWNSLAYGEHAAGVSRAGLYEAIGHPSVSFDHYDSALKALTGEDMNVACYYLYDEDQIKFKADPNLIRIIDQRVKNTPEEQARQRFNDRLKKEIGKGGFNIERFPEEPADMPDKANQPTLGVMHLFTAPVEDGGAEVPSKIQELYEKTAAKHGGTIQNRSYKNYVLFLAPDQALIESAIEEATRLVAVEDLLSDSQQTADLSTDQFEELQDKRDTSHGLLGESVRSVYRHLFYVDDGGLKHVTITSVESGGGTTLVDAVLTTLDDMNRIIRDDDGAKGRVWFEQKLWQSQKSRMTTAELEAQFARKPGLPYLLSTKPLRKTVARMVNESGYAYWDNTSETAFWNAQTQPDNWPHGTPLPESPDVRTSIADSNVKIGDDYALFTDIEALLDQHVDQIEPKPSETVECAECGTEIESPEGQPPHYCEDCRPYAICSRCGTQIHDKSPEDEPVLCEDCSTGPEPWSYTTDMMAAQRAFNEVLSHAKSKSDSDSAPGVESVIIEIGGDKLFTHASFLAQRPAIKSRASNVSVDMEYRARGEIGGSTAQYTAEFKGPVDAFTTLNQNPESFSSQNGGEKIVEVKFHVRLDEPEPITGDEDDVLSELADALDSTGLTVRVQAEGPSVVAERAE